MKTPTEFVEEWMETICSNNVENIVSLYKEEAVLLGTLDGKLRKGHSEIKEYFDGKVDVVLSDMAVNTTGNKNLDSIYTGELCIDAMNFSKEILSNNGKFISKIFMGSTFNDIVAQAKKIFRESKVFKPNASRKGSKESFIICKFLR